jgi:hypothetical protein
LEHAVGVIKNGEKPLTVSCLALSVAEITMLMSVPAWCMAARQYQL